MSVLDAWTKGSVERMAGPVGTLDPSSPDLLEWLASGKLVLLDNSRQEVTVERYSRLPATLRAQAQEEFDRLVSSNAKAAVIFLRG